MTNTSPIINADWLERMRSSKPDFLRELFEMFLDNEPKRLAALAAAVAAGDQEQVRYLAHSLKGAAATLGLDRLRDACRELEFAAKEGREEALTECCARIKHEAEGVFALMRQVMAQA